MTPPRHSLPAVASDSLASPAQCATSPVSASARAVQSLLMAADLERVLRYLDDAAEFARTYRFEMTDDYRQLIARIEAMPRNQSGAERGGRWIGSYADAKALLATVMPAARR